LEHIPTIVDKFRHSLRVLIVDSKDVSFSQKVSKDLQKSLSQCEHLECLKLESEESIYLHWCNARYRVRTKKLLMTLRRSTNYRKIIRNINRCLNPDVEIDLFYDTYVCIENHKLTFLSHGPINWGGDNTVTFETREFEAKEIDGAFYKLMTEFGVKVRRLSTETDIRPDYFQFLFPNIEYLEMFARASRKVAVDTRFQENGWKNLTDFALEVDPSFTLMTDESLLVNMLGDVLNYTNNLATIKVIASQSGLKVSENSLLVKLKQVSSHLSKLTHFEFLSPFCIRNSGLTAKLAEFLVANCPALEVLRDVASWSGSEVAWSRVARSAKKAGFQVGWAKKTNKSSLYTIEYDIEGWCQTDTGHSFELYNNLYDDWEVVEADEEVQLLDAQMGAPAENDQEPEGDQMVV